MTTADLVNQLRKNVSPYCPEVSRKFAGATALNRISNYGCGRTYTVWNESNPEEGRAIIRLASWIGFITGYHLHHVTSVAHGGSFNYRNILITPPALNARIADASWSLEQINQYISSLTPTLRKNMEIPNWWSAEALTSQFVTFNAKVFQPVDKNIGWSYVKPNERWCKAIYSSYIREIV